MPESVAEVRRCGLGLKVTMEKVELKHEIGAGAVIRRKHHESGKRHESVKAYLREKAQSLPPHAAMPRTTELLKELNVARGTITRAVQELQADGILMVRRGSGVYTTLQARHSRVAFVAPWLLQTMAPFHQVLMDTIIRHASEYGMFVEKHLLGIDEEADLEQRKFFHHAMEKGRYAGIITTESVRDHPWSSSLLRWNIPVVVFTSMWIEFPNAVIVDVDAIESQGITFLREHGVSKIALMDWVGQVSGAKTQFRDLLEKNGLTYRSEWDVKLSNKGSRELIGYREFTMAWKRWKVKPDGLISTNDQITVGMVQAALDLGIKIPEELRIVTHANKGISYFECKGVLRLDVDIELAARKLLGRLRDLIHGGSSAGPEALALQAALT